MNKGFQILKYCTLGSIIGAIAGSFIGVAYNGGASNGVLPMAFIGALVGYNFMMFKNFVTMKWSIIKVRYKKHDNN